MYKEIYNIKPEIGISNVGGNYVYATLQDGIENMAEALNEVIQQYQFLSGAGFATNHVTGAAPAWTLSGRRILGDAAQDFIFGMKYEFGDSRKTSFRLTFDDASTGTTITKVLVVPCTICSIQEWSGAATDDSAISFEIRFDAKPTLTNAAPVAPLVIVSIAGAVSGKTQIYVNPEIENGNTYVYKTAASVSLPQLDAVLTTGWTSWDGSAEITATTGNKIMIVEIDGDSKAVKGGIATVTSLA